MATGRAVGNGPRAGEGQKWRGERSGNDSKKEATTTETDRNKWEKAEGKTVRNLLEVARRFTGALFIITPKLAVLWGGVSAALELSLKNLEQGQVRLWNQTTRRGDEGLGPCKK